MVIWGMVMSPFLYVGGGKKKEPCLWVCHREEVVCFRLFCVFYGCGCSDDLPELNRYHIAAGDCKGLSFWRSDPLQVCGLIFVKTALRDTSRNHHLTKLVRACGFAFEEFPHQICSSCPFSGLCMNASIGPLLRLRSSPQ